MEVVLLEFSRVAVSIRIEQNSALALALLPKTFESISVLVAHGATSLVESALEVPLVAVAVEDFSALAMLHVVLPLALIHGAVLLEVHRAFHVGVLSRASAYVALLEARHLQVVEQAREHTVGHFVLLKQFLFFFVVHLSRPEEGSF